VTAPKHPSTRRRRNKVSTSAKLYVIDPGSVTVPPLPPRRHWLPETEERWTSVHTSPMAAEFTDADLYSLYDLAELWDDYLLATDSDERIKLSKEIRIKGQSFGLTPLDRRRLSWEIEKGEQAEMATRARRSRQETPPASEDDAYAALM
jgi:hypothetical protein